MLFKILFGVNGNDNKDATLIKDDQGEKTG
jgi:hypothetical protein